MLKRLQFFICLLLLSLLISQSAESKTWTDNTGNFRIDGTLVDFADGNITLKKSSGKTVVVPLARLSSDCQVFIKTKFVTF